MWHLIFCMRCPGWKSRGNRVDRIYFEPEKTLKTTKNTMRTFHARFWLHGCTLDSVVCTFWNNYIGWSLFVRLVHSLSLHISYEGSFCKFVCLFANTNASSLKLISWIHTFVSNHNSALYFCLPSLSSARSNLVDNVQCFVIREVQDGVRIFTNKAHLVGPALAF